MLSLIFFACCLANCKQSAEKEIELVWKDERAISVDVPASLLTDWEEDKLPAQLQLKTAGAAKPAILGNYESRSDRVRFSPLIPFSRGMTYTVYFKGTQIGTVTVPEADKKNAPRIVAIFPRNDTVPENLLKVYLQFSAPMRTSKSLDHIYLLDEKKDTLKNIFLDLQPELWNSDNTVLTLWLDPGRIKRDLIPNKTLGNPLVKGKAYTLHVDDTWQDLQGRKLTSGSSKSFVVSGRDEFAPGTENWQLGLPSPGSRDPLLIYFNEPLDYFLIQEMVTVSGEAGKHLAGVIKIMPEEKGIEFIPDDQWQPGHYSIHVNPLLEDLAGNNFQRLFDTDLQKKNPSHETRKVFVINR